MEQNPQWKYKFSESLGQQIAYNPQTGCIICEDGTEYSAEENKILRQKEKPTPLAVHIIKKVFKGTIISQ